MATFLSISPAPVASRPTNFAAAPSKCFHGNVSAVRIPSAGGLRLTHKIHLTRAVDRHSPLRCTKLTITCSTAKPETLTAVTITIAKQLSIDESSVIPETKFSDLGADSLDTVEIMMALEEKFGVSIGEGGAEHISTVQDAADLIEKVMAESA